MNVSGYRPLVTRRIGQAPSSTVLPQQQLLDALPQAAAEEPPPEHGYENYSAYEHGTLWRRVRVRVRVARPSVSWLAEASGSVRLQTTPQAAPYQRQANLPLRPSISRRLYQIKLRAASSLGQPRKVGRSVLSGRP